MADVATGLDGRSNDYAVPSSGISLPVTEWEDQHVASWLASIGLASLASAFRDEGITGDVLVQLDNETLKELGVDSVGQRLALLGGIFKLKETWGIDIEQGDYRPQSEEVAASVDPPVTMNRLLHTLRQRDERIVRLEAELRRTTIFLARFQYDFTGVCRYQGLKSKTSETAFLPFAPEASNPPLSAGHGPTRKPSLHREAKLATRSPTVHVGPHLPAKSPGSSYLAVNLPNGHGSDGTESSYSTSGVTSRHQPTSSYDAHIQIPIGEEAHDPNAVAGMPSPSFLAPSKGVTVHSIAGNSLEDAHGHPELGSVSPATLSSGIGSTPTSATFGTWVKGGLGIDSGPSGRTMPAIGGRGAAGLSPGPGAPPELAAHSRPGQVISPATAGPISLAPVKTNETSDGPTSSRDLTGTIAPSVSSSDQPYKSFRVTVEDPCYNVLPAALKKYKINDNWRLYSLFICYGQTERCLTYEEKPLLLFQKLKEAKQHPVFMLRHIRDVKSPISIANEKAAARKGQNGTSGKKDGNRKGSSEIATRVINLNGRSGSHTAAIAVRTGALEAVISGPGAQLPSLDAEKSYAIGIYPYACEREDEFDVAVGDTFVVLSKTKGWWVVQRDSEASGLGDLSSRLHEVSSSSSAAAADGSEATQAKMLTEVKSGWVPAGCLIETSRPLASISTDGGAASGGSSSGTRLDTTTAPIPPSIITSTSTPGVMLMDFSSAAATLHQQELKPGSSTSAPAEPPSYDPNKRVIDSSTGDITTLGNLDSPTQLSLSQHDRLRVFKRYNHWSYCVKEEGVHSRGWVPSWFIGRLPSSSGGSGSAHPSSGSTSAGAGAGASASAGLSSGSRRRGGSGSHSASVPTTTGAATSGLMLQGANLGGSHFNEL